MLANLPPFNTQRDQAQKVLAHLNPIWQTRCSHLFIDSIPNVLPECNLVRIKNTNGTDEKNKYRKRKIVVKHINDTFSQQTSMLVLAEAESLASYGRKRLALSYEKPKTPLIPKSHSPNEPNMSWNVEGTVSELENFPPNQKIN